MNTLINCHKLQTNEHQRPLSLAIPAHSITCIVGPLASGKSALMRTLAGINAPHAGSSNIFGLDPFAIDKGQWLELRRRVGYVLPNSSLVSHLNGLNNVALPINYHQLAQAGSAEQLARAMLSWLGCHADYNQLPSALSEHDKRLINIARALVLGPSILCVDEAFAHLDILKKRDFVHLYRRICNEREITLILATHDLQSARACGDQFIFASGDEFLWFDNWQALEASTNDQLARYRSGLN